MSELQLGLIVIGVVVVVAVYLFNWLQERRFRRRVERAFRDGPDDVLLATHDSSATEPQRVEPRVPVEAAPQPAADDGSDPVGAVLPEVEPRTIVAPPESLIDYVCVVDGAAAITPAVCNEFLRQAAAVGKPVQVSAWSPEHDAWVTFPTSPADPVTRACFALQLVNRGGAAKRVQIASFRDLVRQLAEKLGSRCDCPEIDPVAQRSADLDRFCAEVDVSVGFHIVAADGGTIAGRKLRTLAEDSGFRLEPEGRFSLRSDRHHVLITLASQDGTPFERDRLDDLMLPGVTLLLDVPRVPDGVDVFDRTIELGRRFADTLDALVVDDRRAPLADAGVEKIRAHLRAVCSAMHARGIEPGGAIALRLFS